MSVPKTKEAQSRNLAALIGKAEAHLAALKAEQEQENKTKTNELNRKIENMHEFLGLESPEQAFSAVAAYRKGLNTGKTGIKGNRLSDEKRNEVNKLLTEGKQVSEVVKLTGVSAPTVYKMRKELAAIAPAAPAAPAEPTSA